VQLCRRRVSQLRSNRYRFVSLDQQIPNAGGLTYAGVLRVNV
jgi:hypothetical protein